MTIDITKLNHEVAERYSVASIVRIATVRMGATVQIEWQEAYNRAVPRHQQNIITKRCFEADHRVELDAIDTEAPFLIGHHLRCAKIDGKMLIDQIFQEVRMNLPGGIKIKNLHRRIRKIPESIKDRVTPVTHIAQMEIDPENVFGREYGRLQTNYERDIDAVMHQYEYAVSITQPSQSAKKRLRDEAIKELERIARAHWVHFENWVNQAQHYLTGRYVKEEVVSTLVQ